MRKVFSVVGFFLIAIFLSGCSLSNLKAKAGLQIETRAGENPITATVLLDGKVINKTPYADTDMKPGTYSLEIRPDDTSLVPYQTTISLKKGVLTFVLWKPGTRPETSGGVIYETEKLSDPRDAQISITTVPDGGIIRVDDVAKGFAPVLVEKTTAGEHSYEVSLPSYETQKNTINVLMGYRMNVTVKLARQLPALATAAETTPVATSSAALASPSAKLQSFVASMSAIASSSASFNASPSGSQVKILPTGFQENGKEVLRVRTNADAGAETIGYAPVGALYPYLKQTLAGWFKISFEGKTGWVSSHYAQVVE